MKKYNFIKSVCCLALALFALASCQEDKGNYSYRPINEIEVSGIGDEYLIKLGERITIIPELRQTIPANEEDLSFLWIKVGFDVATNRSFDTVYRERVMDNIIPALAAGAHNMVYEIKDKNTGVMFFSKTFKITVQKDIGTGWLMLFDNDGVADLRFLNYFNKLLSMREVDLSVLPELGKPKDIVTYNDWNSPNPAGRQYSVTIVSETGFYRMKRDDFSYLDTYHWKYHVNGNLDGFHPQAVIAPTDKARWNAMMVDQTGNYMYYERGTSYSQGWTVGLYCNKYLNLDTGEERLFTPAEKFAYAAGVALFFDPVTKSFVYKPSLSNYCREYTTEPEQFRLKNTSYENPYYVYMRGGASVPSGFAVVKNTSTNTIDLISWAVLTGAYEYKQTLWPTTDKGQVLPDIQNAKEFAMAPSTALGWRPFIYYRTDTKVYLYNTSDQTFSEVYSAPSGTTIQQIKYAPPGTFANHLVIVTTTGSGSTPTTVELWKIAETYGTLTLGETGPDENSMQKLRWTGLPKFVAMDWKNDA